MGSYFSGTLKPLPFTIPTGVDAPPNSIPGLPFSQFPSEGISHAPSGLNVLSGNFIATDLTGKIFIDASRNAYGVSSLKFNQNNRTNVALGNNAGSNIDTSAGYNICIGDSSGVSVTGATSNSNICIGKNTSGAIGGSCSKNIFLGDNVGPITVFPNLNNSLYIANSATDTPLILGQFDPAGGYAGNLSFNSQFVSQKNGVFSATLQNGGFRGSEAANGKQGVATLVAGTVIVANTSITATSRIILTPQETGLFTGSLRVSARSVGVSFTILSTVLTDTAQVAYEIFEPG